MLSHINRQSKKIKKDDTSLLLDRLKRIHGQIEGIEKMVGEGKDCLSVIHQIMAVRSALSVVASKILSKESCKIKTSKDKTNFEKIIINLLDFK